MDSPLSLEVVQCRQFDPVTRPFTMNERKDETQSIYTVTSQQNLVPIKSRNAYLKKRRHVPNLMMIALFLLMGLSILAALVFSILYITYRPTKLCETDNCVRIAASLKESMDTSVDPCDDFYKYACGKWQDEHPIPDKSLINSWFDERLEKIYVKIRELLRENRTDSNEPWAVSQAKLLYSSCINVQATNELGLTPLFDVLKELSLPPVPAAITKKTSDYIEQIARVKKVLGKDVFFRFDIIPDPRNSSENVMFLDTLIINNPLPNEKELEKRLHSIRSSFRRMENEETDESEDKLKDVEITYITGIIKQIMNNGTLDTCSLNDESLPLDEEELEEITESLYKLTSAFYYLSHYDETTWQDDPTDDNYMLVDDLQKVTDEFVTEVNSTLTPKLLWRPFIELVFKDIDTLDLDNKDKVLIGDLEYLKEIALMLTLAEEEELESYVWWVIVDIIVPHSSDSLKKIWIDYINELTNIEIGESRSFFCASVVNELMGMATSWLFVDSSFHEDKGKNVLEMLDNIKQAFASMVLRTDWMDQRTKLATLEKNRKMKTQIGFPDWLFAEKELDEYYESIDLSETEYLSNIIQIIRLMSLSELESIHLINYKNESYWATDPTDVNAFHTYEYNHITVPAGILQFPFYELGLESLNYGAIGSILGHELTHGFDNNGRHYDSNGNVKQWWTNETILRYTEKIECFIDHYNTYYEAEIDDYIDGKLTLNENIADNGGLREAVVAYERWKAKHGQEPSLPGFTHLTHEQLIFLSFAHIWCEISTPKFLKSMLQNSHCPGHVRLLGVLKNSQEFSEAWNCPAGSNMNPSNKCKIW
ncbi:neprilysin-4-like isoform X1 [Apis dorsata]|uniref:neprilysin-4-like isoform X1 n=2 Tax=Apis dorsata TaxID=7462 RepID=UPI0003DF51A5|nr:neprilysin-4-like isoform X1 [Apis dorsata]